MTPTADAKILFSRVKHSQVTDAQNLVLVHGLFGSMENLGGIARLLAEEFTVYSVDLPNHGRSPHFDHMNLESMAEMLAEWAIHEGIENAYWVGHSLGGKAVMELALRHPNLCNKIVVLDIAPVTYQPRHNDVFEGLAAVLPSTIKSRSEADQLMAKSVPEFAVRSFLLKNLIKDDQGFQWRMNLAAIAASYPQLIAANTSSHPPYEKDVLFIKGGDSDYLQEQYREQIAKRFPKASLRVVTGAGHWLHAEKPETVARIISKFLSKN